MKMAANKTYGVEAIRSGNWWALRVPEIRGVHSQVKRLADAESMSRDAIALALDVPPESFDVTVRAHVNPDVDAAMEKVKYLRQIAEEVSAATRAAVKSATKAGISVRDIAHELGVSFQYVSKLDADTSKKAADTVRDAARPIGKPTAGTSGARRIQAESTGATRVVATSANAKHAEVGSASPNPKKAKKRSRVAL